MAAEKRRSEKANINVAAWHHRPVWRIMPAGDEISHVAESGVKPAMRGRKENESSEWQQMKSSAETRGGAKVYQRNEK